MIMRRVFLAAVLISAGGCGDSSSSSSGGADKVATDCLAFGTAVKISGGYRHNVVNSCNKKINVLESSTNQRFSLDKNENQDVVLFFRQAINGRVLRPISPRVKRH